MQSDLRRYLTFYIGETPFCVRMDTVTSIDSLDVERLSQKRGVYLGTVGSSAGSVPLYHLWPILFGEEPPLTGGKMLVFKGKDLPLAVVADAVGEVVEGEEASWFSMPPISGQKARGCFPGALLRAGGPCLEVDPEAVRDAALAFETERLQKDSALVPPNSSTEVDEAFEDEEALGAIPEIDPSNPMEALAFLESSQEEMGREPSGEEPDFAETVFDELFGDGQGGESFKATDDLEPLPDADELMASAMPQGEACADEASVESVEEVVQGDLLDRLTPHLIERVVNRVVEKVVKEVLHDLMTSVKE
ncbi:MAG: chemotaxis protein CheW [Desulfobacterales bacterium]|nr:chemotaxis protein CheW [Desulfobacterales bacterium]